MGSLCGLVEIIDEPVYNDESNMPDGETSNRYTVSSCKLGTIFSNELLVVDVQDEPPISLYLILNPEAVDKGEDQFKYTLAVELNLTVDFDFNSIVVKLAKIKLSSSAIEIESGC